MNRSTRSVLGLAAAVSVALAACTSTGPEGPEDEQTGDSGPEQGTVRQPDAGTGVLPGTGGELARAASRTFFDQAPVVVVADDVDLAAQHRGAGAALALGAPVLLDDDAAALTEELARLGSGWVLTVGEVSLPAELTGAGGEGEDADEDAEAGVVVVPAPSDDAALAVLLDRSVGEPVAATGGEEAAAVVGLERGMLTPIEVVTPDAGAPADEDAPAGDDGAPGDEGETTTGEPSTAAPADATDGANAGGGGDSGDEAEEGGTTGGGELPETELPEPLTGAAALTTGAGEELLAAATAAAAGAQLVLVPGGDPRATSEVVAALGEAQPDVVVGIGEGFGDDETFAWRAATAATGVELPGGGQLVLPGKRYVALYGSPSTGALGVLGEQGVPETIERAAEHARAYDDLTEDTVVPALEIIATVAAAQAGDDGNYSNEQPIEELRPLVDAAGEAGQYVVLDLQPGRSSFLEQTQLYAELLEEPHVGLALDPEWNLGPDEVHMVRIGSVTADEVNEVIHWLADFTRERNLPQKLLVLHQFQVRMIQTVPEVDLSRSELAVLVHADGQGGQGAKQDTWRTLHQYGPNIEWWGWKNFYDEDIPMLTPEQTAQVEPFPHFISYQ